MSRDESASETTRRLMEQARTLAAQVKALADDLNDMTAELRREQDE